VAEIPTPSQIRASRIKHLVFIAGAFLEAGVASHLLCDKLERASFRLWLTLRDKTRQEYVVSALKMVSEGPRDESGVIEAVEPLQEVA